MRNPGNREAKIVFSASRLHKIFKINPVNHEVIVKQKSFSCLVPALPDQGYELENNNIARLMIIC
jgi:hypothetical protein